MHKFLFLLAVPCMLSNNACNTPKGSPKQSAKSKYRILSLQKRDTVLPLRFVADITARRNIELRTRISGILEKIHIEEGQTVKKGQLLFSIDNKEARIALQKADALLKKAIADRKVEEVQRLRTKALVQKKIISGSALDLADARLDAQKAKVDEARSAKAVASSRLSYSSIHAPFDGVIDRLLFREGSLIASGALLTTISDISSVYAYFKVPENQYTQFVHDAGNRNGFGMISLNLTDGSEYPLRGKIMAAESEINQNTGSLAFRAEFDNPKRLLLHGASATLLINKKVAHAILIPQKSVIEIQDKSYVFVLDKDNRARMKCFIPQQRLGNYYLVGSGIDVRDRIVAEGVQKLRDGMTIHLQ